MTDEAPTGLATLITPLLECTGCIHQIVEGIADSPDSIGLAARVSALYDSLEERLQTVAENYSDEELALVAGLLAAAADALEGEVYVVTVVDRAAGRCRGGARPGRPRRRG